jgi:hypothetical protein
MMKTISCVRHKLFNIFLFLVFAAPMVAEASRELSDRALVSKCYALLTGESIRPNHRLFIGLSLNVGSNKALGICQSLVDAPVVQDGKIVSGNLIISNEEALKIARNLMNFHQSWFKSNSVREAITEVFAKDVPHYIYDESVGAIQITALMLMNKPYSELVTGNELYLAERNNEKRTINTGGVWCNTNGGTDLYDFRSAGGLLTGFFTNQSDSTSELCFMNPGQTHGDYRVRTQQLEVPGSGILSSGSYVLMNAGFPAAVAGNFDPMDGGGRVWRRLGQAVFLDLMCRDLPVVRGNDVLNFMQTNAGAPNFRTGRTCMGCHSSMDGMAYNFRQYKMTNVLRSGNPNSTSFWSWPIFRYRGTMMPSNLVGKLPKDAMPAKDDSFHLRPPEGYFLFRSYTGELHNKGPEANRDLASLGQNIAATDDLYACAATRYLKYMTGHSVPLTDTGDPDNGYAYSKSQAEKLEWLKKDIVPAFKQNKNLRELVKAIMRSEYFRTTDGEKL